MIPNSWVKDAKMLISTNAYSIPIAGHNFPFSVVSDPGVRESIDVQVTIDGSVVLTVRCADPPCHYVTNVPPTASGQTLAIRAQSSLGSEDTYVAVILPPTSTPQAQSSPQTPLTA